MFQVVNNEYNVFRSKIPAQDNISAEDTHLIAAVLERTVEKTILRQAKSMERYLLFLATVSSSAPFIGLLGTVIGITFSFRSITAQGSAGLSVVAPGIAEALIATALGLFAAIPALFAYNTFRSQIKNTVTDQRVFGLQLINLLPSVKETVIPVQVVNYLPEAINKDPRNSFFSLEKKSGSILPLKETGSGESVPDLFSKPSGNTQGTAPPDILSDGASDKNSLPVLKKEQLNTANKASDLLSANSFKSSVPSAESKTAETQFAVPAPGAGGGAESNSLLSAEFEGPATPQTLSVISRSGGRTKNIFASV
ncbi:hypothetical protein CHS0354_035343 [Potamilus streckersoni]|uniref:MotA/TolQ/ExbB proton channel domain-containing protein n=1 Tax=Potamilus streckersoni TaxID=2493646 RepID=A0AAE0S2U5_9BIVA|nr:hypothetical protein CHS0354_035343 [Potamilus streckersoni]